MHDQQNGVKLKILYVDDEEINLVNFTMAFEDNYQVLTATTGEEALALFEQEGDVAVVVADQRMTGMTGVEVLERIYDVDPDTIRIVLTAYTASQDIIDAINRGHVYQYILKPWDNSQLRCTIERGCEKYLLSKNNQRLLDELAEANQALREARDELEKRVEERTACLRAANVKLTEEVAERLRVEEEREALVKELKEALAKVKTLSGLLPICASCKKIRDDKGYWNHLEYYIEKHSSALFSHGICPECSQALYPHLHQQLDGNAK